MYITNGFIWNLEKNDLKNFKKTYKTESFVTQFFFDFQPLCSKTIPAKTKFVSHLFSLLFNLF